MKYYFLLLILLIIFIIYLQLSALKYRLGDVVLYKKLNQSFINKILYNKYYKESIANEYFQKTNKIKDFDTLYQIVKERSSKLDLVPKEDELIMHLRIGDVVEREYKGPVDDVLNEKIKYTYLISYNYLENKLKNIKNIKKIIIVGGYHTNGNHSRSMEYVNKICKFLEKNGYEVHKRLNQNDPDEDFIYMCNSKNFLKSGGGFSNLVNKMVEMNGNNILEKCNFEENTKIIQ